MRLVAGVFIGFFSMVSFTVYASEGIISPLADDAGLSEPPVAQILIPLPHDSQTLPVQGSLADAVARFVYPTPTPTPTETPAQPSVLGAQSETPKAARKGSMTVTLLGDSMIDTLGPDGGGLAKRLNAVYPHTQFTVINHGTGGENIDTGFNHLTSGYTYIGAQRPSVLSQQPDVVVLESYGYNPYPFDEGALDKHWLQMAAIVRKIQESLPDTRIVIAATIAPNWDVFGDGAPFINFSPEGKREKVRTIDQYIESTISYANGQGLPLADAYHKSRGSDGNGILRYINGGDHIHYSDAGRALFSQTVADTIIRNRLLE